MQINKVLEKQMIDLNTILLSHWSLSKNGISLFFQTLYLNFQEVLIILKILD